MLDGLHWCAKQGNRTSVLPGELWYISVHLTLGLIYTLAVIDISLVLAFKFILHKSGYCKCSLARCQVRTFLVFTLWTHPLQIREYPLRYAGTERNKKQNKTKQKQKQKTKQNKTKAKQQQQNKQTNKKSHYSFPHYSSHPINQCWRIGQGIG